MIVQGIISQLQSLRNERNIEGMKRYGIVSENAMGIPTPIVKGIAKTIGKNHELALDLWESNYYDARVIAFTIDEAIKVTREQMENWVHDFDSWAICDGVCMHLFNKTGYAYNCVYDWSKSNDEYVKRAAFALIASLSVHDKKNSDEVFIELLEIIKDSSSDNRNYVKKAVNWALRQIGKRSKYLNRAAIICCNEINQLGFSSARWIASDALRELNSLAVLDRLAKKEATNIR